MLVSAQNVHTCIYTYIHTYMHAYIHTYIHAYIHTQVDNVGIGIEVAIERPDPIHPDIRAALVRNLLFRYGTHAYVYVYT